MEPGRKAREYPQPLRPTRPRQYRLNGARPQRPGIPATRRGCPGPASRLNGARPQRPGIRPTPVRRSSVPFLPQWSPAAKAGNTGEQSGMTATPHSLNGARPQRPGIPEFTVVG